MITKLYLNGAWFDGNEDVTDWARHGIIRKVLLYLANT